MGYISKILGNNIGGFVPTEVNGSNSTYFADYGRVNPDCFDYYGGYWFDGRDGGAFCLRLGGSTSFSSSYAGARLMCKHLKES